MPERVSKKFFPRDRPSGFVMPVVIDEVMGFDPFNHVESFESNHKVQACVAHFRDNVSWENTGIIEYCVNHVEKKGEPLDGLSTREEFDNRYKKLDALWEFIRNGGSLRSKPFDDAIVHVGKKGRLYFGGGATHRAAMAWILDIPIPVRPFLIHKDGKFKLKEMLEKRV